MVREIVRIESDLSIQDMYDKEFVKEHEKSHLFHVAMNPLTHALVYRLGVMGHFDDANGRRRNYDQSRRSRRLHATNINTSTRHSRNQFGSKPNAEEGMNGKNVGNTQRKMPSTFYCMVICYLIEELQNNVERYLHLKDFLTWDKEHGEGNHTLDSLKALIKNHTLPISTTGITKKLEKHTPITAGKYYQDAIADYIELQKELGIPTIDEDLNSSGRLNFANFGGCMEQLPMH